MKKKILLLTDSTANPRPISLGEETLLESTYPYLLKEYFKSYDFWQITFGGILTNDLLSQAISYFDNWKPDIIIVNSGINDCRIEPFTLRINKSIELILGSYYKNIKNFFYSSKFLKKFGSPATSYKKFNQLINKFKIIFDDSKIYWIEISCNEIYENTRPGTLNSKNKYNDLLKKVYDNQFIEIQSLLSKKNSFQKDGIHLNSIGHNIIFELIIKKLFK